MAALVISLLPNLSTLEPPSGLQLGLYFNLIISKASQLQLGKPGPCCNFQHIGVGRCYDDNIFFDFITPFTQLPYVKSLTFGNTMMLGEDFEWVGVPAPRITHLSFTRADIHTHNLASARALPEPHSFFIHP